MKKLMSRLAKASWRPRAIAVVLLVGAAGGVTDALASSGAASMSAAESTEAQPPSYESPTEPLRSDSEIDTIARQAANDANEPSPSDIRAVDTTLRSALTANPRDVLPSAPNVSTAALEKSEVIVVTMHGRFTLDNAHVPAGRPDPAGSVLTLIIDAHTGKIEGREVSNAESPGIAALGTSRVLE